MELLSRETLALLRDKAVSAAVDELMKRQTDGNALIVQTATGQRIRVRLIE